MADPLVIDEERLNNFGATLFALKGTHINDRKSAEEKWLRNLRQFRGIYDPEVLALIAKDQSRAYPKLTRWKCIGTIARLMQMLWPNTEKNYGVKESPLPDLSVDQLQQVLDQLVASKGGDPTRAQLTDEEIEKAIVEFAKGKAERMEVKIDDDLKGMEFITLARRVVFSAVLYNIGVLKGPLHIKIKARTWTQDINTGRWLAKEVDKLKPLFEFLPVWDWYPDMTAKTLDAQDGTFERHVMTRANVEKLAQRPDFLKERVEKWLHDHTSGNYQAQWWESVMKAEPKGDKLVVTDTESRKYEVYSYWGGVSGHDLRAAGTSIPEDQLWKTFHANAWIIDNTVIKAKISPLGDEIKHYHYFMFEEDDLSLLGNGLPDTLRDSQIGLCEVTRAAFDNVSVIGPMVEIDEDRLVPGQDKSIRKNRSWFTEANGPAANTPAVRDISVESHLPDLSMMRQQILDFADKESGLPPASVGDTTGGGSEALRTSKNASMFLGAAALPIRDTVRNYDTFTTSYISALVAWNRKYDPNPTRDGDHDVVARGSTSLIAKEVMGTALNEFRASVTPDEAPHLKSREMLIARMKVNDLPVDDFLEDEEVANQTIQRNSQAAQAQTDAQMELITAQVKRELATALEKEAKARTEDASIGTDVFAVLIEALKAGGKAQHDAVKGLVDAHKAGTARIAAEKPATGAA